MIRKTLTVLLLLLFFSHLSAQSPSLSPAPSDGHSDAFSTSTGEMALNGGKKLGISFLGLAAVLQVVFAGALVCKWKRLRRDTDGSRLHSASLV